MLRTILSSLLFVGLSVNVSLAADTAAKPKDVEELRAQRKKLANKKRRIIFNNDGCDAVYLTDKATPEELLKNRTTALVGSQVDSIFYVTWCSGFSHFTHNTKIGTVFTCKENKLSNNKTAEFIKQGTDPLKIMADFCRENDIEIFWSMRMNDTHDAARAWYGPLLFPPLKREHPQWLLGSKEKRTKKGRWTAVDYGRPEIRDLAFRFVEEVCGNYNVDGVELDFFRHLNYFKGPASGGVASREELGMMTDLIRRIRKMTEIEGLRRGRPLLVSIRVPDSVEYCKAMGFDIEKWMQEGLIDMMAVSGYFRLNPWETSVALGHKYSVKVYPCLSESRLKKGMGKVRNTNEGYRARAANAWAAGVDGIYMFNFFDPHSSLWKELGDAKTLGKLDKIYTTGARSIHNSNSWLEGGIRFLNRNPVSYEHPRTLVPGKSQTVELRLGEDPQTVKNNPTIITLRPRISSLHKASSLAVKFNGKMLTGGIKVDDNIATTQAATEGCAMDNAIEGEGWLQFPVDPAWVKKGVNTIEFTLDNSVKKAVKMTDLLLLVEYKSKP